MRFYLSSLLLLGAVAYLDRTNISIAGLEISSEYNLGNQYLGWIFSAFLVGYAGFRMPAVWLATRFGPRRLLSLGVLSWGIVTAFTALLPTGMSHVLSVLLIGIRFALGIAESVIYPAVNQFVATWIPRQERGLVNGLIFAGVGAGSGLTPPLLTWLIADHGWHAAFWFSAFVGFLTGILWWYGARDTPEEHPWVSCSELRIIQATRQSDMTHPTPASAATDKSGPTRASWKEMFQRRDLVALMIGSSSAGSSFIWRRCEDSI